jgi:transposase
VIAVGIDVGKRAHQACFLDGGGRALGRPLHFANTAAGVAHLRERLQALPEAPVVALEASGHYWLGLHRRLTREGVRVEVVNPLQTGALRGLGIRKTKTDRRDAFALAELVRIGRVRASYVPDDAILELRELTRFRWGLVDQVGDAKRRLLTVLDRAFPEFAGHFRDPFGATARELLDRAAGAAAFAALDLADLEALVARASRGRFGPEKAQALHAAARDSLGLPGLAAAAQLEVRVLLAQLALLEEQVTAADAAVAEALAGLEAGQRLGALPGVGPVLAATILAELGDVARFPSLKALVAYAGLDPSVYESGAFHGTRQHISKRGSPYLRRALYLAAHSAHQRNPDLHAYLQRKLAAGKPYRAAVVATAHRLLARIHAVLKQGRPYEVRRPQAAEHRRPPGLDSP